MIPSRSARHTDALSFNLCIICCSQVALHMLHDKHRYDEICSRQRVKLKAKLDATGKNEIW